MISYLASEEMVCLYAHYLSNRHILHKHFNLSLDIQHPEGTNWGCKEAV